MEDYLDPRVIRWSYADAQRYAKTCGWPVAISTLKHHQQKGHFKTDPRFRRVPVDRVSFMRFVSSGIPQG